VAAAAFDPADPDKVVSADSSGVAWIWDVRTGRRLERLSYGGYPKTGRASAVAYNPAGTRVAVGYKDSTIVVIFDTHTGRIYKTANVNGSVLDLEFVGNTGKLAIAGGVLALWQYDTAACCDHLPGQGGFTLTANPHNPTEFVAARPDGLFILTIDHSGKPHEVLLSSQVAVSAQFSPDGSEVVATNGDGGVVIYRVATRKVVATFSAYGTAALDAAFSPDGRQIVAGYQDGTARVWDIASKLQLTLLAGHTGPISSVQFSPDGREITTASQDGTIRVWYAEPRELRTEFTVPVSGSGPLGQVAYVSGRIITADYFGDVFVYSASGKLQTTIKSGLQTLAMGSWNRAGTKIMVVANHGAQSLNVGELWHATGSGFTLQRTFSYSNTGVHNAFLSPDGSRVAIVVDDNSLNSSNSFTNTALIIDVRNTDTGRLVRTLRAVKSIQAVAFNPNGRQIVGIDAAGQIEAWNGTATHPRVLGSPGSSFSTVSFNQSGSEFVVASAGGAIFVWNARDGRAVTSINACPAPTDAGFSPDGSKLVVACGDGTVRVFDAGSGRPLTVIQATSTGAVTDAGFSPDGTSIVALVDGVNTQEIQIWNAELATSSLPALERIARQRVGDKLTAAQQQQYLSGASG
jgi:WD40 repeat protein